MPQLVAVKVLKNFMVINYCKPAYLFMYIKLLFSKNCLTSKEQEIIAFEFCEYVSYK